MFLTWDGSSSALQAFFGLIELLVFLPALEVRLVHQTSLTRRLRPVKGRHREVTPCPCDAEVPLMLDGVVMLHLLSWLPAG